MIRMRLDPMRLGVIIDSHGVRGRWVGAGMKGALLAWLVLAAIASVAETAASTYSFAASRRAASGLTGSAFVSTHLSRSHGRALSTSGRAGCCSARRMSITEGRSALE